MNFKSKKQNGLSPRFQCDHDKKPITDGVQGDHDKKPVVKPAENA